ncbi:hypothetical protein K7X08_018941 [Anisodus acutangulus]|uniref:Uncharacterized protein n=1 Tax=Anisodus acutangulus TaxID=402998 RepID=A0A9Q1R9E1_9SOLA|nr:hypothetical protein K7X08_018941 [Anisodus acutangulus]
MLVLDELPTLGHFFQTKCALEFPFLGEVEIKSCPEMKTFVQLGSVSAPILKWLVVETLIEDTEVKDDLNKAIQQRFDSKVAMAQENGATKDTQDKVVIEDEACVTMLNAQRIRE